MSKNFSSSIHTVLRDLIESKSRRDNIKFTSYQLANAVSMPRSIITKLTHIDESRRVINPRIETLIKIVEFFRKDGFDITIDDLLGVKDKKVDLHSLPASLPSQLLNIPIYSLNGMQEKIGTIDVNVSNGCKAVMALYSEGEMAPFFKSGTIFIVDMEMIADHDNLVAVKMDSCEKIQIRKYFRQKNKIILKSLDHNENDNILTAAQKYKILGVIIQVNAKT